jgi:hypothetical protein
VVEAEWEGKAAVELVGKERERKKGGRGILNGLLVSLTGGAVMEASVAMGGPAGTVRGEH